MSEEFNNGEGTCNLSDIIMSYIKNASLNML